MSVPSVRRFELPKASEITEFRHLLLRWYRKRGRHFPWRNKSATSYERIVAEVLLQRTRAETVGSFFPDFTRQFPSWGKLSSATEKELGKFLQPIGLWRQRAQRLGNLADEMAKRSGRFPRSRAQIECLPGVGQYIANAIQLFVLREPRPLLDANMARVLERYFGPRKLADIRYDPYLQALAAKVVDGSDPISLNWAILDLASLVCKQQGPRHDLCPLAAKCKYAGGKSHGSWEDIRSLHGIVEVV